MASLSRVLLGLAVAGNLSFQTACEAHKSRPEAQTTRKLSNASQGNVAEGLVLLGLVATKKLHECNKNPQAPCPFRRETPRSGK
jgi:hypothetical protein